MKELDDVLKTLTFKPFTGKDENGNEYYFSPGDVLKDKTGDVTLVGHVNTDRGLCGHCGDYSRVVEIAHISELFSE